MSTEFQINGELTYRRTRESNKTVQAVFKELDHAESSCHVTLVKGRTSSLEITGGYTTSFHSATRIQDLLLSLAPFAEGAGSFDCEQEGDRWTLYVGSPSECRKLESRSALTALSLQVRKLTPEDRDEAMQLLSTESANLKHYFIEFLWTDGGRFSTEADMTPEQAREIETILNHRDSEVGDVNSVEVYERMPHHQSFEQLLSELASADLTVVDGKPHHGECGTLGQVCPA